MHCHFLQHEDVGCMKMVRWACPGMENSDYQARRGFGWDCITAACPPCLSWLAAAVG